MFYPCPPIRLSHFNQRTIGPIAHLSPFNCVWDFILVTVSMFDEVPVKELKSFAWFKVRCGLLTS